MNVDQKFFYDHAGYSYGPGETPEQGRIKCAIALSEAEREGRAAGLSFNWSIDPYCDSSEWSNEEPAYAQWQCVCHDREGNVLASLGCIDFGRNGYPSSDPYARVVEAELAAEALR